MINNKMSSEHETIKVTPRLGKEKIFHDVKDEDIKRVLKKNKNNDIKNMKHEPTEEEISSKNEKTKQNKETSWLIIILAVIIIVLILIIIWYSLKINNGSDVIPSNMKNMSSAMFPAVNHIESNTHNPPVNSQYKVQRPSEIKEDVLNIERATSKELDKILTGSKTGKLETIYEDNEDNEDNKDSKTDKNSLNDDEIRNISLDTENFIMNGDIEDENVEVANPNVENMDQYFSNVVEEEE